MTVYDRIHLEIYYRDQHSEQLFSIRTMVVRPYKALREQREKTSSGKVRIVDSSMTIIFNDKRRRKVSVDGSLGWIDVERGNERIKRQLGGSCEYSISVRATGYWEMSGKFRQLGDFVLSKQRKQRSSESNCLSRGVCEYVRDRLVGRALAFQRRTRPADLSSRTIRQRRNRRRMLGPKPRQFSESRRKLYK